MNQIIRIIVLSILGIIVSLAIITIIGHFWNQYDADQAHKKSCESLKNIIEIEGQLNNPANPNKLNEDIVEYNAKCL